MRTRIVKKNKEYKIGENGTLLLDGYPVKPKMDCNGHHYVWMKRKGKDVPKRIDELVCEAFVKGYKEEHRIIHLNGICWDDRLENLKTFIPEEKPKPHRVKILYNAVETNRRRH